MESQEWAELQETGNASSLRARGYSALAAYRYCVHAVHHMKASVGSYSFF